MVKGSRNHTCASGPAMPQTGLGAGGESRGGGGRAVGSVILCQPSLWERRGTSRVRLGEKRLGTPGVYSTYP